MQLNGEETGLLVDQHNAVATMWHANGSVSCADMTTLESFVSGLEESVRLVAKQKTWNH